MLLFLPHILANFLECVEYSAGDEGTRYTRWLLSWTSHPNSGGRQGVNARIKGRLPQVQSDGQEGCSGGDEKSMFW